MAGPPTTNRPRYYEVVDTPNRPFVLVATKLDKDDVLLERRARDTGRTEWAVELSASESEALRMALEHCEGVPPLPDYDYDPAKVTAAVAFAVATTLKVPVPPAPVVPVAPLEADGDAAESPAFPSGARRPKT